MRALWRQLSVVGLLCIGTAAPVAAAEICTAEKLGAAVDAAGTQIRKYNGEAQPRLKEKLKALSDKKGWSGDPDYEDRGLNYLRDGRTAALDVQSNELFTKIDTLGRPDTNAPVDCAVLAEVEAAGAEMLAVLKTKSDYLSDKIDRELAGPAAPAAPAPAEKTAKAELPKVEKAPPPAPRIAKPPVEKSPPKPPADKSSKWDTTTAQVRPPPDLPAPGEPYTQPPVEPLAPNEEGYSIDEIREATRGFFGTISTNLAAVIEHSFSAVGRPTAYVLGTEGGGAFLAGVRYGKGTLYLRSGGTREVHWHGPSIGYDIGAEGSRTLYLIYRLRDPDHLYRMFTGIDGTAYLVGGVGMTLLKGGEVIMAPIRSGIGLRLGASIGYVRFTTCPTWDPF